MLLNPLILENVPCLVVRMNAVLEIDRVELSGEKFSSVDDLVGTLDGEHELSVAEHRNEFTWCTVFGDVVLCEELGESFLRRGQHGEEQLEGHEEVCVQMCKVATTLICETRSCVLESKLVSNVRATKLATLR